MRSQSVSIIVRGTGRIADHSHKLEIRSSKPETIVISNGRKIRNATESANDLFRSLSFSFVFELFRNSIFEFLAMMPTLLFRIATALCFLAVALGAFGAHALKETIQGHGMSDVWNKAVLYHFIHAIALFVLALFGTANRGAWWLLFAGIFLFSGSLYAMALTNLRWLGAITPLGGLCFLAGWAWLIITPPGSGD
jgi:uncharacterized membrane protein YgdD (TMEM256/DUF423 family)